MQKILSSTLMLIIFGLFSSSTISTSISVKSIQKMADNPTQSSSSSPSTYIVYTEQPANNAEPESFHLGTLSSVLCSEDAAKDSLLYVYKNAATGFSAKLTPEQVSQLEKQPGILQVVPSQTMKLHDGVGATNMRV